MVDKNIRFIKNDLKTPISGAEYKIIQSNKMISEGFTNAEGRISPISVLISSKELIMIEMKLSGTQTFIKTHEFKWINDWPLSILLAYPGKYSLKIKTEKSSGAPGAKNDYLRNIHIVQSGENLSKIAESHETTIGELQSLNNISDPSLLFEGQKIKLPPRSEKKSSNINEDNSEKSNQTVKVEQKNSQHKGSPVAVVVAPNTWNIRVIAPDDRSKTTIANLFDENDKVIFSFTVLLRGSAKDRENRFLRNANTPLGIYNIPRGNNQWLTGNRGPYGKNPRLVLNGESGEIKTTGRSLIRIHGGRQEHYIEKSETIDKSGKVKIIKAHWVPNDPAVLKPTNGCLRAYDSDMVTLKEHIDKMNNRNILSGKLIITNKKGEIEEKYKYIIKSVDGANLRKTADKKGTILTTIPNGVTWESEDIEKFGAWYKVFYKQFQGFIHQSTVNKVKKSDF